MREHTNVHNLIYIADDDNAIVDALEFMLKNAGYEVDSAPDERIIGKIASAPPSLLLLDIWMSGANGTDICRILKNSAATKDVPIIMISAHPSGKYLSEECGADDYVSKPFEIQDLLDKIRVHIKKALHSRPARQKGG